MGLMQTSPFMATPTAGSRTEYPDMNMTIDYFVSEEANVCVFHSRPFSKALSWFEYDSKTNQLDFVMEDGDIRNFAIPVDPTLRSYFHNAHVISVIQFNPVTNDVENGVELPLIIHAAA